VSTIVASLVANLTADPSQMISGLNQARSALQATGAQMKGLGGMYPGDALGADFARVTSQVQGNTAAVAANGAGLLSLAARARSALGTISFITAAIGSTKVIYEMGQMGAEIDYTRGKFDRLAEAAGTTGSVLLGDLRQATLGTVSDFALAKQGSDLFQLGLANNADEAVRLSRVMTALGMDTGELTLALANQSKRRLDQLGVSLTQFNRNEDAFKALGLTKEESFKQAFLKTAEDTVVQVGNRAEGAAGSYDRLSASWANYKDSVKASLSDTFVPLNNALARELELSTKTSEINKAYDTFQRATLKGILSTNTYRGGSSYVNYQTDFSPALNTSRAEFENIYRGRLADAARYSGLAQMHAARGGASTPGDTGPIAEQTAEYYESLLKVGTGLTEMFGDQAQALATLNAKYADQKDGAEKVRAGMEALGKQAEATQEAMFLGTLKNVGATEQQQIEFARAAGLMSDKGYQASSAMLRLADAMAKGKLSGAEASMALNHVRSSLENIDGFNAVGYVDVFIRVHGEMPRVVSNSGGQGSGAAGYDPGSAYSQSEKTRATGGPMTPGGWAQVTEYGEPELFTSGGKSYLMAGKSGGYVSTLKGSAGGGSNMEQMHALLSRIPSAEENARALAKVLKGLAL